MAPLAIIYDVHGNLPALEAVLADARAANAQRFLLGGDYALFGPFQPESVAALRGLEQATWIRGNVDRWAANPSDLPADDVLPRAVADCREALGAGLADELGTLPEQVVLDGTRYCHASPVSDMRSFLPEPGGDDEEMLAGASERRVVFGHTHLQFRRGGPDGIELLNPGSVGLPLDGDARAAYALAHDDGSIEHRRVDYDRDAAIAALQERFGDVAWAQRSVRRLQTSRP
ncbi:MAG TPA: metallophosphoesterase family protein [Solirubrobacteraceae bacterium]|nr:metallophosphoesterase family protein [Solirubrobacteraceae bacterium]